MKCRRCHRTAVRSGGRGLCKAHYDQQLRLERPVSKWVDPEPAKRHIADLHANGMRYRRIAELTGLSVATLNSIVKGKTSYIQFHNEQIILDVKVSGDVSSNPMMLVPAFASSRRLRSLCRLGFSQQVLADRLGISVDAVNKYVMLHGPLIRSSIAADVSRLFDELQLTPVDSPELQTQVAKRVRMKSMTRGYPPPFAWDEDSINSPDATPDCTVPVQATTRRLRALHRMGFAQNYMAERLGVTQDEMSAILRFHDSIPWTLMDAAEKLFDELRCTPSDDPRLSSRRSAQVRSNAAKYGWPLPDDLGNIFRKPTKAEMVIDRSNDKRLAQMRELKSAGMSNAEIARHLNVNQTTVYNWLSKEAA